MAEQWIVSNAYLSQDERDNNAKCLHNVLAGIYHWSINAICAVAGNFDGESNLNPGIWQNLDEGNTRLGLGLGQWTPATKLLNWASENNLAWGNGDNQCRFLVENEGQWHTSSTITPARPPITWQEFMMSTDTLSNLTSMFYGYWEDPGTSDGTLPHRIDRATYYYQLLTGHDPQPPDPPEPEPGTWGGNKKILYWKRYPF